MRALGLVLLNYASHLLMAFFLTGLQSSLWLHIFGYVPGPQIWICVLNFWALQRRNVEGIIFSYLLVFLLAPMTSMPLSLVFPVVLTNLALTLSLKNRVIWSGLLHFSISTAVSAATLPLIILLWSRLIESTPISSFHFFSWVLSPFLTALFSLGVYPLLNWIDHLTQKEPPRDVETGLL